MIEHASRHNWTQFALLFVGSDTSRCKKSSLFVPVSYINTLILIQNIILAPKLVNLATSVSETQRF